MKGVKGMYGVDGGNVGCRMGFVALTCCCSVGPSVPRFLRNRDSEVGRQKCERGSEGTAHVGTWDRCSPFGPLVLFIRSSVCAETRQAGSDGGPADAESVLSVSEMGP